MSQLTIPDPQTLNLKFTLSTAAWSKINHLTAKTYTILQLLNIWKQVHRPRQAILTSFYNFIWSVTLKCDLWPQYQLKISKIDASMIQLNLVVIILELRPLLHCQTASQIDLLWPSTLVWHWYMIFHTRNIWSIHDPSMAVHKTGFDLKTG